MAVFLNEERRTELPDWSAGGMGGRNIPLRKQMFLSLNSLLFN